MRDYLIALSQIIQDNWDQGALTDYSKCIGEDGIDYTYGQLYGAMVSLCERFAELGIHKGDHVAICGANSASWVVAYLAVAKYQGVSVMIMHTLPSEAIAKMVLFSDAVALIADKEIIDSVSSNPLLKGIKQISLEELPQPKNVCKEEVYLQIENENNLASICFTSGSAGMPKGVMIPYKGVYLGIFGIADNLPVRENRNIVSFAPLAHILGFGSEVLTPLCQGSHIYFAGALLTKERLMQSIMQIRPYRVLLFPMILNRLANAANIDILKHLTFIECCLTGGAKISEEVAKLCEQIHLPLTMGYGLTETSGLVSLTDPKTYRMGSVGKPIAAMQVKIADDGEIIAKGENVMLGYYKDEKATREKIDADGWLHTGDRGYLDEEGFLYVEGRINQDMIVLPSGENIHPENIEAIINAIPNVVESLVLARDGKLMAIVRKNKVVPATQFNAERNAILTAVNPQLPSFSQLFGIEFITDSLQRTEKQTIKRYLYQ